MKAKLAATHFAALVFCLLASALCSRVFAQGTAFTYQGRLNDGANPASGTYDLQFAIFDAASSGAGQGEPLTNSAASVNNGLFTVTLDFGTGVFDGADRWLEIGVRTNGGTSFFILSPRQKITPTPYALHATDAASATIAASVANGGVTTAALAAGAITADKLASNSVGPNQLSRRYLSGSVPYSTIPATFQFFPVAMDKSVSFAAPLTVTPVITLTIDTAHPALPPKGPLLITARGTNGFTMRVPTAAVGVEVTRTGLDAHRPSIGTVNGNPAMVGLGQIGFSIGLVYSRSSDAAGGNWPSPSLLALGYLGASALDVAAGRPAITFLDALGGVSYVRANDTDGTSWLAPTQIITPAALGGGAARLSGVLVNGNPALLAANYTTNVYYLRANDDAVSSWSTPAIVFNATNSLNSIALGMAGGYPAMAVVANQRVYFARANDTNGVSWPAATVAVLPNPAFNIPQENVSLMDIAGKPAIGFVGQAGQNSPNQSIFFVQSTDPNGTGWNSPQSIFTTSSSPATPMFTMIGGVPAVAYTYNGLLRFIQSFASGPFFTFPVATAIEPADQTCFVEAVNGQPAIAFYGNGSLRFIRQGTPPPNSTINWIAVEP